MTELTQKFRNKKILLGVTGGIAVYKAAEFAHLLIKEGAEVQTIMTSSAEKFVTALTFQALTNKRVYTQLFEPSEQNGMDHISLAKWADLILVAPASANFLARLNAGFADDLLTTLCLATTAPIAVAPAMNCQMWLNTCTQKNVVQLVEKNIFLIGPAEGSQACGDVGPGRMMEPVDMILEVSHLLNNKILKEHRVLVTAGPTREPLDPVRYISNNSSGKMGYAIAQAAIEAGADVTLVSGPTNLLKPTRAKIISVNTAEEMYKVVMEHASKCSIFIGAAAVSDYRPVNYSNSKIKKDSSEISLKLKRTFDIISDVAKIKKPPITVGFSAETGSLLKNAAKKQKEKKLDIIVANEVGPGKGFEMDYNKVTILKKGGKKIEIPLSHKLSIARRIISVLAEDLNKK